MVLSIGLGLAKGSSLCLATCGPGIVPFLISKQYDWKKCLKLGIIFNLPRMIVLTILGMILGYISYSIKEWLETTVPKVLGPIQVIAYGILGIFILILGAYMFTTGVDARENLKDLNEQKKGKKANYKMDNQHSKYSEQSTTCKTTSCDAKVAKRSFSIRERFKDLESKPVKFFLLWGAMLSFACLGEVIITEAAIIWTSIGVISTSFSQAILFGGLAMLVLAIGASIPLITVATLSGLGSIKKFFDNAEKLEALRTIGGIVLVIMGLIYTLSLIMYVFSYV